MAVRRRAVSEESTETTSVRKSATRSSSANRSWGSTKKSYSEPKRETVRSPYFSLTDGETKIVKFVEELPIRFARHFIQGQGYSTCPASIEDHLEEGQTCPLCDKGHSPSDAYFINLLDMSEGPDADGDWQLKTFSFGPDISNQLGAFLEQTDAQDRLMYNPINQEKWYWMITRIKGDRVTYKVMPVKSRDLLEDHGIAPVDEQIIEELSENLYDEKSIFVPYLSKLAKQAANLSD